MGQLIKEVSGSGVSVPGDDIDTDRITPARFLRCVTFDGLAKTVFFDERYAENGDLKAHPLNEESADGAAIMVSGRNFGCGSSREHAPQALVRAGFNAVIAESFAEIFFGNAVTLGMVCITVSQEDREAIAERVSKDPAAQVVIRLEEGKIQIGTDIYDGHIPKSAKDVFLAGEWDPLSMLLDGATATRKVFEELPYTGWVKS